MIRVIAADALAVNVAGYQQVYYWLMYTDEIFKFYKPNTRF